MDNGQSDITNDFMLVIGYCVLYFMVFPDISKTVHWINITLGTLGKSDTMNDFVVFELILTYMSLFSHFICCFEHYLVGIHYTLENGSTVHMTS